MLELTFALCDRIIKKTALILEQKKAETHKACWLTKLKQNI